VRRLVQSSDGRKWHVERKFCVHNEHVEASRFIGPAVTIASAAVLLWLLGSQHLVGGLTAWIVAGMGLSVVTIAGYSRAIFELKAWDIRFGRCRSSERVSRAWLGYGRLRELFRTCAWPAFCERRSASGYSPT
jgi:hypothetical protein